MKILKLILLFYLVSCSPIQSIGLKTSSEILVKGSGEMETETNWYHFRNSAPANLKTVEGLLFADPENLNLLKTLIKGYSGLAYGVHETLLMEEKLREKGESFHLEQALSFYSKAVHYGLIYLGQRGVDSKELFQNILNTDRINETLESNLNSDDFQAVFYTAHAWGGLINLQRTELPIMANMPIVKSLFDWVCLKKPQYENGACSLFYGLYELSRPRMLGGDPQKGKKILQDYMKAYPFNMLAKVTYLEFVIVKEDDKKSYFEYKRNLKKDFANFARQRNFAKNLSDRSSFMEQQRFNLLNSIAEKRFEILTKYERKLF